MIDSASSAFKSNHAVMRAPPFNVTGTVLAVGKIHRVFAGARICCAALAHPAPVSPKPCNITTVLVAPPLSRGSTTMGFGYSAAILTSSSLAAADDADIPARLATPTRRCPYRCDVVAPPPPLATATDATATAPRARVANTAPNAAPRTHDATPPSLRRPRRPRRPRRSRPRQPSPPPIVVVTALAPRAIARRSMRVARAPMPPGERAIGATRGAVDGIAYIYILYT